MALTPFPVAADFDTLPISGLVVELDGTIVAANEAAAQLAGRPIKALLGRKAWEFAPGAEHIWNELVLGAQTGAYHGSITLATPESPRAIRYVATAQRHGERTLLLLLALPIDAHGDEQGRLEALGLFAGGIAHDFNNQLVSVLAEASAAREDPTASERVRDALRRIEASAQRMAQLTRQLLAYAQRGRVVAELLDPDVVVKELRDELQRIAPTATLAIELNQQRVVIRIDRTLLGEVVTNLVANAADALPARSGTITIMTAIERRAGRLWWRLEVTDQGVGIDAHVVARIFDPFFTTKRDRHGLGLSAAQGIVRRFGGDIAVDSETGRGTKVRVMLPVVSGVEPKLRRARGTSTPVSLASLRILVADDEPSVRATIQRLLVRRGAQVVVAGDGDEAAAALANGSYSLVLLDVMMPNQTGYQLLPVARRLQPAAKVMLMSGYTHADRDPNTKDEADAFLEKPFTAKQLNETIDGVLDSDDTGD